MNALAGGITMQAFQSFPVLIIWFLWGIRLSLAKEARFHFQALDVSSLNKASDACIAIFTVNAPCPSIADFGMDTDLSLDIIESKDLLQGPLLSSLISLQDSLKGQCGSKASYKPYSDGSIWKPIYAMEEAIQHVAVAYMSKGVEEYCDMWFQMPPRRAAFCDECYKIILWEDTRSSLSEDTSRCDIEQSTNPHQPLLILFPTCSPKHTLKAGDVFLSFNNYIRAEDVPDIPIANGTRTDCWDYLWWDEKNAGSPPDCREVVDRYELEAERFFLYNPSLDQNVTVEGTPTYDFPSQHLPWSNFSSIHFLELEAELRTTYGGRADDDSDAPIPCWMSTEASSDMAQLTDMSTDGHHEE